jgi:NtrC-family two-component system sensor histidine kinase KinB
MHRFTDGAGKAPGVVMVLREITAQREFDKMCGEFVLRASHELRTPIASVRMGLGLLGEKLDLPAGSRDRELYETVQHEVSRMVDVLNDLLDLSRLRMGEQRLELHSEDIGTLIDGARQRFAKAARDAGVLLRLDVEPGLPSMQLCRRSFDRVFDNLINNSLRHTPKGGSITLSAHLDPRQVTLAVTDTGEGIAHANQAAIFQPFARFGSKRGAGLGLAICQEIVRQHGGEIKVHSQPKRGAEFTISLPIMN